MMIKPVNNKSELNCIKQEELANNTLSLNLQDEDQDNNINNLIEQINSHHSLNKISIKIGEANFIGSEGVEQLCLALQKHEGLREFHLIISNYNDVSNEHPLGISECLSKIKELSSLHLCFGNGNQIEELGAISISEGIKYSTKLLDLSINIGYQNYILQTGADMIFQSISQLLDLQKLSITIERANSITSFDVLAQSLFQIDKLEEFRLLLDESDSFSDSSNILLSKALNKQSNLRKISLKVGSNGFIQVAQSLAKLDQLEEIELTIFTTKSVELISTFGQQFQNLKYLSYFPARIVSEKQDQIRATNIQDCLHSFENCIRLSVDLNENYTKIEGIQLKSDKKEIFENMVIVDNSKLTVDLCNANKYGSQESSQSLEIIGVNHMKIEDLVLLQKIIYLQELNIDISLLNVNDQHLEQIFKSISNASNLISLSIAIPNASNTQVTEIGCMNIAHSLKNFPELHSFKLQIGDNQGINQKGLAFISDELIKLNKLKSISILIGLNNKIGKEGSVSIRKMFREDIESINLKIDKGNQIDEAEMEEIFEGIQQPKKLRYLILNLTGETIPRDKIRSKAFETIKKFSNLYTLLISITSFSRFYAINAYQMDYNYHNNQIFETQKEQKQYEQLLIRSMPKLTKFSIKI